jgi:hypothetical protein
LTGTGAAVKAMERVKGSKASGTTLKVSFQSPLHCSESQVPFGECGAPVDKYTINAGASASSKTISVDYAPNYDVQLIRTASSLLVSSSYFEKIAVSGYFQLSYGASVTSAINAEASAADMRDVIESLTGINTVDVTRSYSADIMNGVVTTTPGAMTLSCALQNCDFESLTTGELIRVGGIWYKVRETYDGVDKSTLPLGLVNDSSIITSYGGNTDFSGQIFRWARGYEWTVTFLSTDSAMHSLSSPAHGLNPLDSSISIRAEDCTDCIFIDGLTAWYNNFLDIQAHNRHGYGPITSTLGTPKEIPGPPEGVNLKSASGTELFLFFNKPASAADVAGITHYTVEWDTSPLFNHVNKNDTRSCTSQGHGLCVVNGATLDVEPPFEFTISSLNEFTTYYVRVAARNSLSQQVAVGEADSTNWSATAAAYPEDQPPSAPISVNGTTGGIGNAQLFIIKPKSTGGKAIDSYNIQVSTDSGFGTVSEVSIAAADVEVLDTQQASEGPIVYDYTGLSVGQSYYIRARAKNEKGYSLWTNSASSVLIAGKPDAPASVSLSTAITQNTPISFVDVTWTSPVSTGGDGIDSYVVEVWQEKRIAEEQLIRFIHPTENKMPSNTTFLLRYSDTPSTQENTFQLVYNIEEYNIRSEIMNMGYLNNSFPIGNIEVSRSAFPGKGYEWIVTFLDSENDGDVPPFFGVVLDSAEGKVDIIEKVPGSRVGGTPEKQILRVVTDADQCDIRNVKGHFRFSFAETSDFTPWLSMASTDAEIAAALGVLPNLREVSVSSQDVLVDKDCAANDAREWTITMEGQIGNQPPLYADYYLNDNSTTSEQLTVSVFDGDNSLDVIGKKVSLAVPGEKPYGYTKYSVSSSDSSFKITGLTPGEKYFVSVSARNRFGLGIAGVPTGVQSITLPKQIPLAPSNVDIAVNPGSATTLQVSYDAPLSDGGSDVSSYRIELDSNADFGNPIATTVNCPTANKHTIYEVKTSASGSNYVKSGYFTLTLQVGGNTITTDAINYDSVATLFDESGVQINTQLTATIVNNTQAFNITGLADATSILFPGNRIQIPNSKDSRTVFNITSVVYDSVVPHTEVTVDQFILLKDEGPSSVTNEVIYRYIGGRGTARDGSRVTCVKTFANQDDYCPDARVRDSGSMESKIELLGLTPTGVKVERDILFDSKNGVTWRITFLDDSPENPLDFTLSLGSNEVLLDDYTTKADIAITHKSDGQVYPECTGKQVLPADKTLQMGQLYYARVSAINEIGFGPAQVAGKTQKPMVTPGAPTSVVVTSVSKNELRVTFNPPVSDGGDKIEKYLIEYATDQLFANAVQVAVTYLEGGSPYSKTISGLTTGTSYYIRVAAINSQGTGAYGISTPDKWHPHEVPDGPQNVKTFVTSDTMLTVSFEAPTYNGGDAVTSYTVEWDTVSTFNGAATPYPRKGSVTLDGSTDLSTTLTLLTAGETYYVRVFAENKAGKSVATISTPASAIPSLQVPGKPHTLNAAAGDTAGVVTVSWQRPRIPHHGVPCSGLPSSPNDCPSEVGGTFPSAFGGSDITEYVVSYNEKADFTGFDGGSVSTPSTSIVLNGLTSRRTYYIRVLARNARGSGPFCKNTEQNCLIVSAANVVSVTVL